MGRQIFISYARKNRNEVALVREALESLTWGGDVVLWQDVRDIEAGDDWQQKLWTGLSGSEVVIACVSFSYLASRWCREECEEALRIGAVVIPCLLEPCDYEGMPVSAVNFAVEGVALSSLPTAHQKAVWRANLARTVRRRLGTPTQVTQEQWSTAFELAGLQVQGDAETQYSQLLQEDPAKAREVHQELIGLVEPGRASPALAQPPPRAPVDGPSRLPPEPPAKPLATWTRYLRIRVDRSKPWGRLVNDVQSAQPGDPDAAYVVVGEARQEPVLFVRRMESELPRLGAATGLEMVTVPFPSHEYAAADALDVQKQISDTLVNRQVVGGLTPDMEPRLVLQRVAQHMPLVVTLGEPLRALRRRERSALESFLGSLRQFFGASSGRWPVRLWLQVEEAAGEGLHGALYRSLLASDVPVASFTLSFPDWDEVHGELHDQPVFAGCTATDLAKAEAAYVGAMHDAQNLTDLLDRMLHVIDAVRESR